MTYTNGENPGAPYGARWDDGYPSGPAPRAERYDVTNPWVGRGCDLCALARKRDSPRGGCPEHAPLKMQVKIPGGPGPDIRLPCAGEWDLFDTEEPCEKALALCAGCPFQDWCLETAIANTEHGIWAATNRQDRKDLMKLRELQEGIAA